MPQLLATPVRNLRRVLPLLLLGASAALSPAAESLSVPNSLAVRQVSDVALAPDGREALFRIDRPRTADEGLGPAVAEIWRMSLPQGAPALVPQAGFHARRPAWSGSGNELAWLAQRDRSAPAQIHLMPRGGGVPRILTQASRGVQAFEWSPDGTRIAFTSWEATASEPGGSGRDWFIFDNPKTQLRLHVIDVRSGESAPVTPPDATVHFFAWSPDGKRLAVAAAPTPSDDDRTLRTRPYVIPASGGPLRLLAETAGKLTDIVWSVDGRWIAWLGSTSITDPAPGSVFAIEADATDARPRNLTAGLAGTATSLTPVPGKQDTFAFRSEEWQDTLLRAVSAATGTGSILSRPGVILSAAPSFARDGKAFAVAASTPQHPSELFSGTSGRSPPQRRTDSNPWLGQVALGTQEIVRWRSKDGLEIEGVLIKPPGFTPGKRYPVVLHIHGGSESVVSNGWQAGANNLGQVLAARGFLVLYPNYRGSRGRGVEFVAGNRRDVMGREWDDTESGLDFLIAGGLADADRAGIYGFSWGGYAAGWGATFASQRFKAAVGGAGIYNWISEAGTNNTRMHEQLAHWDAPLYENFSLYLERSPIFHVRKANTPMLLLHGERDESCPLGQAIEFHTALKWKRVPVELVVYPREGHGLVEHEHQLDFVNRAVAWFERYLVP